MIDTDNNDYLGPFIRFGLVKILKESIEWHITSLRGRPEKISPQKLRPNFAAETAEVKWYCCSNVHIRADDGAWT